MPPFIVAVDLGGTQIRAALCGTDGQIFRRVARLTEAKEGPDAVIARIFEAITEAIGDTPVADVAGIGIGAPGPLNPITGVVLEAPNLPGWHNTSRSARWSASGSAGQPSSATTPMWPAWPSITTAPAAAFGT